FPVGVVSADIEDSTTKQDMSQMHRGGVAEPAEAGERHASLLGAIALNGVSVGLTGQSRLKPSRFGQLNEQPFISAESERVFYREPGSRGFWFWKSRRSVRRARQAAAGLRHLPKNNSPASRLPVQFSVFVSSRLPVHFFPSREASLVRRILV